MWYLAGEGGGGPRSPRRWPGGAGVAYLVAHRILYGGWTVYAAGDHFVGGELTVMGNDPDRIGRTRRLAGLLLDRGFGLAAWMPGYLLAVPALAVLLRRRPPGWALLVLPLAAGWATATWVALTMHGWWWRAPGGGRRALPGPGGGVVGGPGPLPGGSWGRPRRSGSWPGAGWWSRCSTGGAR